MQASVPWPEGPTEKLAPAPKCSDRRERRFLTPRPFPASLSWKGAPEFQTSR